MSSRNNNDDINNIEILEGPENFASWRFELKILLNAANALDAITYTAEPTEASSKQKDAKAQKAIVMSISKKNKQLIMSCKYAAEMYNKLVNVYEGDNGRLKDSLLAQYFGFRIKDVARDIAELESIVTRLNDLGHEIKDQELTQRIISALPQSFENFVISWDSAPTAERTSANLIARLLKAESKTGLRTPIKDDVAFKATRDYKHDVVCYACKSKGHYARNCSKNDGERCKFCKKDNHASDDCYFRPKNKESKQTEPGKKVAFLVHEDRDDDPYEDSDTWTVDSGCSSHMCNNEKYLTNVIKINSEINIAKDGIQMAATKKGDISFQNCILRDVLYVPELATNLLSVNKIIESGGLVNFWKNKVVIKKDNFEVHGKKNKHKLFEVKLIHDQEDSALLAKADEECATEWHRKLAHLGQQLKSIVTEFEEKWDSKVNMLRCDNAEENSSRDLQEWAKEKGIKFDYSPPFIPKLKKQAKSTSSAKGKENKVEKSIGGGDAGTGDVQKKNSKATDEKPTDFDDGEWEQGLSRNDKKNRKTALEEIMPQKNTEKKKEMKKPKEDEVKTTELVAEVNKEKPEPIVTVIQETIKQAGEKPKNPKQKKKPAGTDAAVEKATPAAVDPIVKSSIQEEEAWKKAKVPKKTNKKKIRKK